MALTQRKRRSAEEASPAPAAASAASSSRAPRGSTFFVAKRLICCGLGSVYFFAFLAAYFQNRALIGAEGLVPCRGRIEARQREFGGDRLRGFFQSPSVWWLVEASDENLARVAFVGLVASAAVVAGGHSSLLFAALWLLYFSVVAAGEASSTFYSYGWESQLLETGFLAVFLCSPLDARSAPTLPVLYLFRWLCFRISVGAGLIKVRGGSCWARRECLWYHFETQPVPSPLSFVFHFLPRTLLSRGVDVDLFVQLYTSVLVLVPGFVGPLEVVRRAAGLVQAAFMVAIAASGNFSILNHLTIIPALACLDDGVFTSTPRAADTEPPRRRARPRTVVDAALLAVVAYLSLPVVHNLVQTGGGSQVMNASFDPWRLVNTYGAFGSVGERRYEPVVSLSTDGGNTWAELQWPCKPGDVSRRPCFSAPYHHRLDWNIWFIGFKPHQQMLRGREQWLYAFLAKVLDQDHLARSLLDAKTRNDPALFPGPANDGAWRVAKVDMYHYEMAGSLFDILAQPADARVWWNRTFEEVLIPPVALQEGRLALFPMGS